MVAGLYVVWLQPYFPGIAGHLINANAAQLPGGGDDGRRLLVPAPRRPETVQAAHRGVAAGAVGRGAANKQQLWEAITQGRQTTASKLALGITAVLIRLRGAARPGQMRGSAGMGGWCWPSRRFHVLQSCSFLAVSFPWSG